MKSPKHQPNPLSLELTPAQESDILARVEENIVSAFRQKYAQPSSAPVDHRKAALGWQWWAGALTAAAVVVVLSVRLWWAEPSLQGKGIVLPQGVTLAHRQIEIHVPADQSGTLVEAKRWNMRITPHSRLTLLQKTSRTRKILLQRGLVTLEVSPGMWKEFVVESHDIQVVVTGTRFSVEREASWMRVELWQGQVVIQQPGHQPVVMKPGSGLRINVISRTIQRYPLPPIMQTPSVAPQSQVAPQKQDSPQAQNSPLQRIRWLVQQRRYAELHQYTMDLAHRRHDSTRQRRMWLQQVADLLYRRGYEHRALQTLVSMARLGGEGADTDFAMAINACHKIFRADTTHCIDLGQEYLQLYAKHGVQMTYYACQLAKNLEQRFHKNPALFSKDQRKAQQLQQRYRCGVEK